MKILVIGGTRFVGRHLSEELGRRGHDLTLFHRGQSNPALFPQADRVFGDRETELGKLGDQSWDVVIDTCGYAPEHVELSVDYLRGRATRYVFISSAAVYEPTTRPGIDESAALQTEPEPSDPVTWWHTEYARNKVACERLVLDGFGADSSLLIRPGMIMGPHDPLNYFTYWVVRARRGGDIVAPGDGDHPLQFIDARDLASFVSDMIDRSVSNVFTVDGPVEPLRFASFLDALLAHFDSEATVHWIDDDHLEAHGVEPDSSGLPYWLRGPESRAYFRKSIDKALDHGLAVRPLAETVDDVVDWYDEHVHGVRDDWVAGSPPDKGLTPTEEEELVDGLASS